MGDKMTPMPFPQLMDWVMGEHKKKESVFGVYRPYLADESHNRELFGRTLETPIGPAAGPHTQLAQNIAAAYYAGSRFFELKTVQILDGDDLPVEKPCIRAEDECYNCEWSTELLCTSGPGGVYQSLVYPVFYGKRVRIRPDGRISV